MAIKLAALRAGRPLPPLRFLILISVRVEPKGHSGAGRIRSIEKSKHVIGNRTRDIPPCSVVHQPTTLPRALTSVTTSTVLYILILLGHPAKKGRLEYLGIDGRMILHYLKGTRYDCLLFTRQWTFGPHGRQEWLPIFPGELWSVRICIRN
jgi:hypothetical protein